MLVGLGGLAAAIPALASSGQEAWVLVGTVLVTAVAPGLLLVGLGMRNVEHHPLVIAMIEGQRPTSFTFRRTWRGYDCHAVVVAGGIPHHFAIPRELMPA